MIWGKLQALNGPQTIGNGRAFWASFSIILLLILIYPIWADPYDVGNSAYFGIWIFMGLGLSLMWGHAGIMSFGQTAFFGLAGYGYGVIAINIGATGGLTIVALFGAIALAALAAAVLGYFMIYGRVGGVYFGIVTFATTLALAAFLHQTAGPEWVIGKARLNGFNGMGGMAPLAFPWGDGTIYLEDTVLYYFVVILLLVVYLFLRFLVNGVLAMYWWPYARIPFEPSCWVMIFASTSLPFSSWAVHSRGLAVSCTPRGGSSLHLPAWGCQRQRCRLSGWHLAGEPT